MLESADESPLWGIIPYRVAVPALFILALVLTGLLVFSLERWHSALSEALLLGSHPQDIPQSDLVKIAVLVIILGATALTSTFILQYYRTTQSELTRIQVLSRHILENITRGVITIDLEGDITVTNPAARQMLNFPSNGDPMKLSWLCERHQDLCKIIREALKEDRYTQDLDLQYTAPEGTTWLRATTFPLLHSQQERTGVVILLADVTRLKSVEKQLRRLDLLAVTESLAAGVAHEIRNPLTAIDLNLRLLRDEVHSETPNSDEIDGQFEILTEETRRLNHITEEFLAFSRPSSSPNRKLAVADVVLRVLRLLEAEAAEKNIRFQSSFAGNLPEIRGDPERMEQVFLNILVNAMESMANGGEIKVNVNHAASSDAQFVEVSVTDQGPGVSKEHLPRLFDPYFTTKPGGTGLGLAIAHRIVTDHDGEIAVENVLMAGSRVRVLLPVPDEEPLALQDMVDES